MYIYYKYIYIYINIDIDIDIDIYYIYIYIYRYRYRYICIHVHMYTLLSQSAEVMMDADMPSSCLIFPFHLLWHLPISFLHMWLDHAYQVCVCVCVSE